MDKLDKQAWSASGNLETLNPNKAVTLQANFKTPGYYTLQFSVEMPTITNNTQLLMLKAEITWSVEGNKTKRLIHVINGGTISGTGQGVHCKVFDDSSGTISPPVEYPISILLTKGRRPSYLQPPTLVIPDIIGTRDLLFRVPVLTTFGIFPLPIDSGAISTYITARRESSGGVPNNDTLLDSDLQVQQNNGANILKLYGFNGCNDWVPMAPGVNRITLVNSLPAGQQDILFTVTLGIEG